MKFIIDAHLAKSIAAIFTEQMLNTSELENGNRTKDKLINILGVLEDRILITKDNDFYYSYSAAKKTGQINSRKVWKHATQRTKGLLSTKRIYHFEVIRRTFISNFRERKCKRVGIIEGGKS
jgi:predicted nuclease of predicted toxin-antitoxin system